MHRRPQRLAAELIGTFGVVLFSAGAVCADQFLRGENLPGFGPLGIALAYGFAFGTLVTAVGCVCGGPTICGHLNPAVTLGFWGTRRISTFDAIACCIAQLAGAAAAGYALRYALPEDTWRAALLGTPAMAAGITRTPAMLIEGAGAFFLVFVMFAMSISATALDASPADVQLKPIPESARWFAGLSAGLTVTVGALFGLPFTGGSLNPARAFGTALAGRYWTNHGVYWIGPLGGGVLAAWIYDALFLPRRVRRLGRASTSPDKTAADTSLEVQEPPARY
jgi:glycerol uptake facilitator-like aquaporin